MLRIFSASFLALLSVVYSSNATAQSWPNRYISLIVPFGPGSGTDLVARTIAAQMSEILGQQVIIENVGGAGGVIGVSRVAKATPDGYQMVIGAVDTFAQSQSLYAQPRYNPLSDFTPIGLAVEQPLLLTVRKDLPVTSLQEFISYVKANQSRMQFGSAGVGAAPHLACSQLTAAIGASVTHVPYRGSAPAMQDMIGGTLDYYCPLAGGAIPLVGSNSIKALAVLTAQRSDLLPALPTAREQGLDVSDGYYWMGFYFPAGTPSEIVVKMNGALKTALNAPAVKTRLREQAATVVAEERQSPEYLRTFNEAEIEKWSKIMKSAGVTPQ